MNESATISGVRAVISKRYYDIVTKLSAISIDGFQCERYIIKINHSLAEIARA